MPKITFKPTFLTAGDVTIEVAAGQTLLEAAEAAEVAMGDACGGNCGCSTCHVHVVGGFDSLEEMEDREDDALGMADDVRAVSRLGCQAKVGDEDLIIYVTPESQQCYINEHPEHRGRESEIR